MQGYLTFEILGNNYSTIPVVSGRKAASQRRTGLFDLFLELIWDAPSGNMIIKDGLTPASSDGQKPKSNGKKAASDNQVNKSPKQSFNKLSETKKESPKNRPTFWDVYHEYEAYAGKLNDWAEKTRKKYETIRYNLKSFRDWKRKNGLPNFDVTFEYFDEDGFQSFVDYLREVKEYVNTTIRKDIVMLKVVIRWAYRRRYHNNSTSRLTSRKGRPYQW